MRLTQLRLMRPFAVALLFSGPLFSGSLNIDFGTNTDGKGGPLIRPSAMYGAAANQPGYWNKIDAIGYATALNDLNGDPVGASLMLTFPIGGTMGIAGCGGAGATDPNKLRCDQFDDWSGTWSLIISSLADSIYDVYFYAPMDSRVSTGDFTIAGHAISNFQGSASESMVQRSGSLGDWDVYTGVEVTDGQLVLQGSGGNSFNDYVGLAGLQLVDTQANSVPEPATVLLISAGLIAFGALRRRPGFPGFPGLE